MCFPCLLALSAALLSKNLVMKMRGKEELRKEEENVRRGIQTRERREFFSLLKQRGSCILWKTNASKQSRAEADGNGKEEWKG